MNPSGIFDPLRSHSIGKSAMSALEHYRLSAIPPNYTVWYTTWPARIRACRAASKA